MYIVRFGWGIRKFVLFSNRASSRMWCRRGMQPFPARSVHLFVLGRMTCTYVYYVSGLTIWKEMLLYHSRRRPSQRDPLKRYLVGRLTERKKSPSSRQPARIRNPKGALTLNFRNDPIDRTWRRSKCAVSEKFGEIGFHFERFSCRFISDVVFMVCVMFSFTIAAVINHLNFRYLTFFSI